ncbi:hypothetical protein [Fodinicola feengrottensis]|uniref:hypothetical protein n=1 Tax=Fodinicola feengrottensis TaxID=435914 RepID=UPI0024411C17|nr:hypothetical protein [Fodinicola feengrottensis]
MNRQKTWARAVTLAGGTLASLVLISSPAWAGNSSPNAPSEPTHSIFCSNPAGWHVDYGFSGTANNNTEGGWVINAIRDTPEETFYWATYYQQDPPGSSSNVEWTC